MIRSQLEIIAQGQAYINGISDEDYNEVITPLFISSTGAHIRHVIDHYQAIITGSRQGVIDYDHRARGTEIETNPQAAMLAFQKIHLWLKNLPAHAFEQPLQLSTEISISEEHVMKVATTLARELIFAGSHAIHHFAMIAQIAQAQENTLPTFFGIAPATASFMRKSSQQ